MTLSESFNFEQYLPVFLNKATESSSPEQYPVDEIHDDSERIARAYVSVEVRDTQGDLVPIDEIRRTMNTWMKRGAPISDEHSNRIVGKGLNWSETEHPKAKKPAISIDYQIHKDYSIDDQVWDEIKSGKRKGLSFGGRATKKATIMKDADSPSGKVRQLAGIETYEVASVFEPANDLAENTHVNFLAKSGNTKYAKETISSDIFSKSYAELNDKERDEVDKKYRGVRKALDLAESMAKQIRKTKEHDGFMVEAEEHPEFTVTQVKRIVADHLAEDPAYYDRESVEKRKLEKGSAPDDDDMEKGGPGSGPKKGNSNMGYGPSYGKYQQEMDDQWRNSPNKEERDSYPDHLKSEDVDKKRIYLKPGEQAPKGARVQQGAHGGQYYETGGQDPNTEDRSGGRGTRKYPGYGEGQHGPGKVTRLPEQKPTAQKPSAGQGKPSSNADLKHFSAVKDTLHPKLHARYESLVGEEGMDPISAATKALTEHIQSGPPQKPSETFPYSGQAENRGNTKPSFTGQSNQETQQLKDEALNVAQGMGLKPESIGKTPADWHYFIVGAGKKSPVKNPQTLSTSPVATQKPNVHINTGRAISADAQRPVAPTEKLPKHFIKDPDAKNREKRFFQGMQKPSYSPSEAFGGGAKPSAPTAKPGKTIIGRKDGNYLVQTFDGVLEYQPNEMDEIYGDSSWKTQKIPQYKPRQVVGRSHNGNYYVNTNDGVMEYTSSEMDELGFQKTPPTESQARQRGQSSNPKYKTTYKLQERVMVPRNSPTSLAGKNGYVTQVNYANDGEPMYEVTTDDGKKWDFLQSEFEDDTDPEDDSEDNFSTMSRNKNKSLYKIITLPKGGKQVLEVEFPDGQRQALNLSKLKLSDDVRKSLYRLMSPTSKANLLTKKCDEILKSLRSSKKFK